MVIASEAWRELPPAQKTTEQPTPMEFGGPATRNRESVFAGSIERRPRRRPRATVARRLYENGKVSRRETGGVGWLTAG
jgi:hypothetical protein